MATGAVRYIYPAGRVHRVTLGDRSDSRQDGDQVSEEDWQKRSRRVYPKDGVVIEERGVLDVTMPARVQDFVKTHKLSHGDIVSFGGVRRDRDSWIVVKKNDKFELIRNPDTSFAGFLTIPLDVFTEIDNGFEHYKELSTNRRNMVLRLPPSDKYLKQLLKQDVPAEWNIYLRCDRGSVQDITIETEGHDPVTYYNLEKISVAAVKSLLGATSTDELIVEIRLPPNSLHLWTEKFGPYDWENPTEKIHTPDLPVGWQATVRCDARHVAGQEGGRCLRWRATGPSNSRKAIVAAFNPIIALVDSVSETEVVFRIRTLRGRRTLAAAIRGRGRAGSKVGGGQQRNRRRNQQTEKGDKDTPQGRQRGGGGNQNEGGNNNRNNNRRRRRPRANRGGARSGGETATASPTADDFSAAN